MNPPDLKQCTKCGDVKPLEMFYKHKQARDGRNSSCIECAKTRANQTYLEARSTAEGRRKLVEQQKLSRSRNKSQRNSYNSSWFKAHPEAARAKRNRQNKNNPHKNRARVSRWQKSNPDKVRAISRKDREKASDSYIAHLIGVSVEILRRHPEYIIAKRAQLLLKRSLKQQQNPAQ